MNSVSDDVVAVDNSSQTEITSAVSSPEAYTFTKVNAQNGTVDITLRADCFTNLINAARLGSAMLSIASKDVSVHPSWQDAYSSLRNFIKSLSEITQSDPQPSAVKSIISGTISRFVGRGTIANDQTQSRALAQIISITRAGEAVRRYFANPEQTDINTLDMVNVIITPDGREE